MNNLGDIIKKVRGDLSYRAFAVKCIRPDGTPLSHNTIAEIEKGTRKPDTETIEAIAANPMISDKYSFKELSSYVANIGVSLDRDFYAAKDAYPYVRELPDNEIVYLITELVYNDLELEGLYKVLEVVGRAIAGRAALRK